MSKSAVVIVGLPGSGKTEFAKQYSDTYKIFDDIGNGSQVCDIISALLAGVDVILIDPNFCDETILSKCVDKLVGYGYSYTIAYFSNDPVQCIKNVKDRDGRCVEPDIRALSRVYNPPLKHSLDVWRP